MKAIEFPEKNIVYAKDHKDYQPLPAYNGGGEQGAVITCWELSWRERIKILFTGKLWWTQFTFRQKLQPQKPSVDKWAALDKEYWDEYFKKKKSNQPTP